MFDKYWWENLFCSGDWETAGGKMQTEYFAKLILSNIPDEVSEYLSIPGTKILDWGCALGQAVNLFQETFPKSKVTGLDFAEKAIEKATQLYLNSSFRSNPLDVFTDHYDAIYTSNVLEHFRNPLNIVKEHISCAGKYYIVLVPYNQGRSEGPINDGCHAYSFTEDSFPNNLYSKKFIKCYVKVIPPIRPELWCENQILVIYERRQ